MQDFTTFISHHPFLFFAALAVFVLATVVELLRAKRNVYSVTPHQATQKINRDNAVVIDIRNNESYKKGHIINATNVPAQEVRSNSKKLEKYRAKPLIIVCNLGTESQKIAPLLSKQGYNVYSLTGGMRAWTEASMPVIKD